jgi:hypothetical protein
MAQPDWNPDTGGRSLAEILREAGVEAPRTGRRRRWDDPDETGIRQRGAGPAAPSDGRLEYGRRRSDVLTDSGPVRKARPRAPEPTTAAIPGMRPERTPSVPATTGRIAAAPVRERSAAEPSRKPVRKAVQATAHEEDFSTGPIPVVRPEDLEDDAGPRESAMAWLRFAGELLIALAAGVGVYFAATVLWEMLPHVAVLLAPLAVTGLVAGVAMWRQRMGREQMGPKLLAVLVFAGTLLTIAPAAGLLAGT